MRKVRFRTILVVLVLLLAVAAVVASGILPRIRARRALRAETEREAEPVVNIFRPDREAPSEEVVLPANIQAFVDAPIFARTNGYLKRWYHDIGSRVKKGELLAEIESPEVDQQLQQAQHDLATAQANLALAQTTAQRYVDLLKTDSVAKQDVDNAVQSAAAQTATVKSAQANVARLQQMVDFEKLYAPFDGVVTARNTDIGQLIESGSAGGTPRELFHVAAIDRLRVFVQVPQVYSHDTLPGMQADLTLPELPGRRFPGKLVRTANAIDPNTRTLLVEVDVVNTTGLLMPGAYTEIHFKLRSKGTTLIIPSTSLMFRSDGLRVPVVVSGNKIQMLPVTVGRDFGNTIEVLAGLPDTAEVVANPPDALVEGELVRISRAAPAKEVQE
ncbi:MAG: efflux RND transporter periplasmic adaptor subunit [Acidobacteriaceae bacterium]|nr:efflux RND transporter periplasmic adaptor subunit [Acidobacteriaceae bacterium]MBV8569056.1 efflux RND transporter periplasmic adaptor subunit [Acidobacteriaceae bacterium]